MYADRYDALRGKVDRTMDNLNAAKNFNRSHASPLKGNRGSQSPPMRDFRPPEDPYAGPPSDPFMRRATQNSTSPYPATEKRVDRSPLRVSGGYIPPYANTAAYVPEH